MPRLFKFAILGFLAYAVVTATPVQQAAIVDGGLAVKDAAIDACQREGSLCARAIDAVTSAVSGSMTETGAPWLDDQSKRGASPPPASAESRRTN